MSAEIPMPHDVATASRRFHEIASSILDASARPGGDSSLQRWRSLRGVSNAAQYVRYQADLVALAKRTSAGEVVVDAGCGFGFAMIAHALLGASAVRGVEFYASTVATVESYLPLLPEDVASRLTVTTGSASAMPYDDASASIVLSIEAISHYLDVDGFTGEAWRVLRPGGVLIVADRNNGANPIVTRRGHDLWEALELGPEGRVMASGERIGVPYVTRRALALEEHFPELSDADREQLAGATAGMTRDELLAAAGTFVRDGVRPTATYRRGQLAVEPAGIAMERLFRPRDLARALNRRGFEAKAYGYWGGASGKPALRAVNSVLSAMSALTLPTAFSFRVVAKKPL